ncbi:transcription factor LRL1-like [Aristolochia californica]|uniref:transcription factor LRL1-like n=1 Tax=Aristolochia californica TaxID=171875 RepID=UPI0035E22269
MYKPTTFSLDMNVAEVEAPIDMLNNGNSNNLMVADVVLPAEVGDKLQNEEDPQLAQISQKNSAPSSNCAVADPHVTVTIAAQSSTSGTCDRILGNHLVQTTSQVAVDSRHRRARLTKGVKALQKLLPNAQEMGGREHVLDSATDYVKLLKLQIRALSQSRLGGEATVGPFSHLAEYGHYLCHEQMAGEPLEETMRRLMEVDMPAARKFLESKGLYLVPHALATDPSQNY